jgi:nucleotide-binding universal stress UspA family protein
MRLLLAVDDSEYSQAAVEQVATHFNPQTTEIKMLHVVPPAYYSCPPQMSRGYAPEMEELEKEARSNLDKLANVVGSHGHTGLERLLLGSVAESVVRHARTSVLVVRKKPLNSPSS